MYIILGILAVVALAVIAILIAAAFQPREFRVERSIETTAPADAVFAILNDLHRWREWSPYDKRDPDMAVDISEPASGPGATYAWNGNRDVGAGRMTINHVEPGRCVDIQLEFERPFACKNHVTWSVEEKDGMRRITWAMDGRNDDLMPRIFGLIMNMDKMCGADFEAGLASLKSIAEAETM